MLPKNISIQIKITLKMKSKLSCLLSINYEKYYFSSSSQQLTPLLCLILLGIITSFFKNILFVFLNMCICCAYVRGNTCERNVHQGKNRVSEPCSWSYRPLEATWHGYKRLNLNFLKEQFVLLSV